MVSDDEIRRILVELADPARRGQGLVDAANRGGGRDNITAVAFRVAEADAKEGEESATLISRTAEQAGLTGERMRAATRPDARPGPDAGAAPPPAAQVGWAVAILAAIVVIGGGFLSSRSIYFLGTDDQGDVALYRGLPYSLPLGISLYSKQYSIPVQEGDALGGPPARLSPATGCEARTTPPA